jgi:putative effector of murein hydrolase
MKFLKPSHTLLVIFALLVSVTVIFALPMYIQVQCIKAPCPPLTKIIQIYDLQTTPFVSGVNYLFLALEIIIAYLVAGVLVWLFTTKNGKGR